MCTRSRIAGNHNSARSSQLTNRDGVPLSRPPTQVSLHYELHAVDPGDAVELEATHPALVAMETVELEAPPGPPSGAQVQSNLRHRMRGSFPDERRFVLPSYE